MDDYDRSYYAKAPVGDGSRKVLRGNGWFYVDLDPDMRAANRYRMPPLRWYPYVGVRCATSGTTIAATQVPDPGHRKRSATAFRLAPEKPLCTTPGGGVFPLRARCFLSTWRKWRRKLKRGRRSQEEWSNQ